MSKFSRYYHKDLEQFIRGIVPWGSKKLKIEIDSIPSSIKGFDYIILPNTFAQVKDVQLFLHKLSVKTNKEVRIVAIYFNFLWKPVLDLATSLGLRKKHDSEPNWLSEQDISNLFMLEDYQLIKAGRRMLFPVDIPFVSFLINKYLAQIPIVNNLCLTTYQLYRKSPPQRIYSTSIIIPARNEAGNMRGILQKLPGLGSKTEVIFVEDNSNDNTYEAIQNEIRKRLPAGMSAALYKGRSDGKGQAVRLGFSKAKNDILIILDADLTVAPVELSKFYRVLAEGKGDFANGTRLVYPMEKQAMRTLNYLGNTFFSIAFTYLLGQRLRDTLCGTKVLFRRDYLRIAKNRSQFGDFDPFGDYDLLFGANALNLKIVEVPVRYRERIYGKTNIHRFRHGLLLIKMVFFAAKKIKFK